MLIIALVLALIGLVSLVTAVVTSNELIAWVCIAASVLGVMLLIVDAIRERQARDPVPVPAEDAESSIAEHHTVDETYETFDAEYPDEAPPVQSVSDAAAIGAAGSAEDAVDPVVDDGLEDEAESRVEDEVDVTTVTAAAVPDTTGAEDPHEPNDTSK